MSTISQFALAQDEMYVEGDGVVSSTGEEDYVDPDAQVFNGVYLTDLSVPSTVAAGGSISISGTIGFDCPLCTVDRDTRVVVEFGPDGQSRTVDTDKLSGRGDTDAFRIDIPAPADPEKQVGITLRGQRNPPGPNGWKTDEKQEYVVNSVTEREKNRQQAASYAPYVAGGGGVGYLVSQRTGRDPTTGAMAGALAGAGLKRYAGQLPEVGDFAPSPWEALAYAALLGAGVAAVSTAQDYTGGAIGEVTSTVGSSAVGAVTDAGSKARDAVRASRQ